jgi:hypothetical protein
MQDQDKQKENQQPKVNKFIISIGELTADGTSVRPTRMLFSDGFVDNKLEVHELNWLISMGSSETEEPWLTRPGITKITPQHLVAVNGLLATLSPLAPVQARQRLNWLINWIQASIMESNECVIMVQTE